MKNYILILLAASTAFFNCSSQAGKDKTSGAQPKLDSLIAQFQEEKFKLFPLEATSAGDNRYNELMPNTLSSAYRKEVTNFYTKYRNALLSQDRSKLSENDQMNYDVLKWECDIALEGDKFKVYLMPLNQFWSLNLTIGQMASGSYTQPFKTVKDYDNWLSRLNGYTVWCDSAIANMKEGIKTGYVLPKSLTSKVIPQFESLAHGPIQEHLFYAPIKNIPAEFPAEEKNRLTIAYKNMIEKKIIPAHKRVQDFLIKEYLPASRTTSGISAVPMGKEFYDYMIKLSTTTTKSADEIFKIGEAEVARLSNEMLKVKEQVGFKGDLKSFFDYIRNKKELMPFTKPEQVVDNFNAIHERMKPNLAKLFDKTPKTPFEVRRTESFREASASAEYMQGSQDGTRPGIFYVPVPDASKYNMFSDEDLFLHEAIPGHHYQISLQQENTSLATFRRLLTYSAFAEGWALYCESMGKELGLYKDPYQYFGMLSAEMHRAIRLVVDVGIHTKGWTREQAIQYSKDHEAESEASIVSEIERYMAIPGQALSYKIGQLKILELRAKAEKALGSKFKIAEFHNQVLDSGSIPLKVLEDKIDRWIIKSINQ